MLRPNTVERFPGTEAATRERGHLVEIAAPGVERGALLAFGTVWVAGALLLAVATGNGRGGAPPVVAPAGALRVLVVGVVYSLALVRATLAWRVGAAAPYNAEALPWAAVFLAAFPLLVFLFDRWPRARDAAALVRDGASRVGASLTPVRSLTPARGLAARAPAARRAFALLDVVALVVVAGAVAFAATPLELSANNLGLGLCIVGGGVTAWYGLQRVLVADGASAFADRSPLGMLMPQSERGFGAEQMWRAFVTLLVVLGLYVGLAWSVRAVPSPVPAVAYAIGVALAYTFVRVRERVRPRLPTAQLARTIALGAVAVALATFVLVNLVRPELGATTAVALAVVAAAAIAVGTWVALLPLVRPVRGWPYRAADVLPHPLFAALPAVLILVAGMTSLARAAITIGYALAVAALLVTMRVFAAWWHRETSRRVRAELGPAPARSHRGRLLVAPLLVPLVVYLTYGVVDRGLLLLLVAAALVAATVAAATVGRFALGAAAATAVLVLGVVVPQAISVDPAALTSRRVAMATPQVRWAAMREPAALARQLTLAREETGREIVATLQQDWGMRMHAATGGTFGGGLFSLPFSGAAITEEVSLTDNAFSVWVLAEHGFAGGVAVLGAFVAFGLVLFGAAHEAARRVGTAHLALLLAGLAAYVTLPALYMAAANVSLVPLTGQNFPLLGLRSGADVAFVAWLAALAVIALPAPGGRDDDTEKGYVRRVDLGRLRRTILAVGGLIATAAAGVGVATWRATHAEIAPFTLDAFAGDLRELVRRGDVVVRGDTLAVAAASSGKTGLRDGDLVRGLVARSNAFARGASPTRSQCLDRSPWFARDGDDVRVRDTGCRVTGVTSGARWRGVLTAAEVGAAGRFVVAGLSTTVVLDERGTPRATVPCDDAGGDTVRAAAVDISCGDAVVAVRAGTARGARPTARRVTGEAASLDGEPLGAAATPVGAGSVLTLGGGATLVIDSLPARALGFARLRNGVVERVTVAGTPPLVAALDSTLARTIVTARAGERAEVALTLDVALSRAIGDGLAARCGGALAGVVRRCAAIVVDPERGDVLAVASWQRPGLRRADYEPVDANFRAHRPGSVVKPIFASAVLARYPGLVRLGVAQPADTFSAAAGWTFGGRPLKTARNGCAEAVITWACFLPNSNNRYAVTLGMLGMATEPTGGDAPTFGTAAAEGAATFVGGVRLARRVALPARRPAAYATSPLARNLDALFGARVGRRPVGAYDESLWAAARDSGLVRGGASWQRVSPTLPDLPLDDRAFRDLRHVAGFLIGETDNQWSNAALAKAVSRIATGRAVELRLLRRVGETRLAAPEFAALPFGVGRDAVLDGMRGVVRGTGTAREVAALFASPALDLIGKTGTLDSDALEPLSAFMWAGQSTVRGAALCPAAGVLVVELEPGAAERLRAATLFADAVAPALRDDFGWGGAPCRRAR